MGPTEASGHSEWQLYPYGQNVPGTGVPRVCSAPALPCGRREQYRRGAAQTQAAPVCTDARETEMPHRKRRHPGINTATEMVAGELFGGGRYY